MERLNHFILWCKGWYESANPNLDLFDEAVIALKLDDYVCCKRNSVIGIVTNYLDFLLDKNVFDGCPYYLRLHVWNQNILRNMNLFNVEYEKAVLITLRHFFAYHIDDEIPLTTPTYSRKLYKMGFVCPKQFGNSYKMQNHKVKKYFNKYEKH
jgi:hypothetical protein